MNVRVPFSDEECIDAVPPGGTFISDDEAWIRTDDGRVCVRLCDGYTWTFDFNDIVRPVEMMAVIA